MYNGGAPINAEKFYKLKKKLKCYIIEDSCHALGAMYSKKKNEFVGNCKYGDIAIFSFHPVKTITTGEGGMLVTNNLVFFKRSTKLRNHGIQKKNSLKKNNWSYEINEIGFNYRLNDIQSTLGISQLKKIRKFIKRREVVAKKYNDLFKNNDLIKTLNIENSDIKSAWHLYIININFKKLKINKNELIQKLHKKKIGVQVHYIPNYYQPLYKRKKIFQLGTKKYFQNSISIPIYPRLKNNEIIRTAKTINQLLEKFVLY